MKVALLGAGRIVQNVYLPLLLRRSDIEISGIYDINHEVAHRISMQSIEFRVCKTIDELFQTKPDVTIITCPNKFHAELSIQALNCKSHVICEKPMATSYHDSIAMLKAAKYNKKNLMISHQNRFRPEIIELSKIVKQGKLGVITSIEGGWLRREGVPGVGSWFTNKELAGGGVLLDLGPHIIDLLCMLIDQYDVDDVDVSMNYDINSSKEAVWYLPDSTLTKTKVDNLETGVSCIYKSGGVETKVDLSWSCDVPEDNTYIKIKGTDGVAKISTLFGLNSSVERPKYPLIIETGDGVFTPAYDEVDILQPYQDQSSYFLTAIKDGKSLFRDATKCAKVMRIIETIYKTQKNNSQF